MSIWTKIGIKQGFWGWVWEKALKPVGKFLAPVIEEVVIEQIKKILDKFDGDKKDTPVIRGAGGDEEDSQ